MTVGLFTESFLPVINGVSTSVVGLASELARQGHSPVVIAPRFPGFMEAEKRFSVQRLPSWRTPLNPQNPFAYPPIGPLPAMLRCLNCDIVHTHHPFGIGLQGARLARRLRVPLVSTFHTLYMEYGHYVPFLPSSWVAKVVSVYLRWYYNRCAAVFVPSHEAGRRLKAIGVFAEKLHVVPTGVPDARPVSPDEILRTRERFRLSAQDVPAPDSPIVLFVGRLAKEKNLDLLFHALARGIADIEYAEPVLVLAGSGPYRETCERRVQELGLGARVRFTGFLTPEELAPLYAQASVFAFPSSSETQGIVLCEAQSYGLPCVVVSGGGAMEFVRDGVDALVVPSEVEAFGRAIARLLYDTKMRQVFAEAARTTPNRLTPTETTNRIVAVYRNVIDGPAP